MMIRILAVPILVLAHGALCAQQKTAAPPVPGNDPVLMTVDGRPVSRSEFETTYKKNNKSAVVTREALDEYLDLFINYKLKVRAAEEAGLDTVSKFKTELDGYRKQLARPYLIDRELNDELIREAYDRSREEVRASHILIKLDPDASPADTLAAWKRISALRDRVVAGEDFKAVAAGKGGSEDPSAEKNGGDLGWFSVLQMVYPFETAAFNTPVGQVSKPVRTRFGYHIIKSFGRRPAQGEVKVAHIMVRSSDEDPAEKQAAAETKIREAFTRVSSGEISFADAALKYSDDEGTSGKGGELPMFGSGKMIEEFEKVAFALKKNDELSQPFRTSFGWHIVKRLDYKAPPSFDEAKADLKARIARDSRAEITRKKFLNDLRTSYKYREFPKDIKALDKLVDTTVFHKGTTITDTLLRKDVVEGPVTRKGATYERAIVSVLRNGKVTSAHARRADAPADQPTDTVIVRDTHKGWVPSAAMLAQWKKPVFSIDGRFLTQADFLGYVAANQKRETKQPISGYMADRYKSFVDDKVLEYEDGRLEEKYPEFRALMKEYRDGILLFELTDQKVWSKAVKDSTGLEAYYQEHRMDWMHPVRYECDIYTCKDAAAAKALRDQHKKGKRGAELITAVSKKVADGVEVESGTWSAEERPVVKGLTLPGLSNDIMFEGGLRVVDLKRVLQPEPKPLSEARGLVTAAYQDQLEKDWLKELRAKYPVRVEQDVLYSIH